MALASPEKRKWSARAWWLGLHVYVYAVLAQNGSLSPHALSPSWLVLIVVVAVVNVGCYLRLQRSTPGFVEREVCDLESGRLATTAEDSELARDSDSLVSARTCDGAGGSMDLHFCELCQLTQPLRTKHCKDCGKCVRQYDHHCDCAGTCVGEQNRRTFVAYLLVQAVEGVLMISVAADAVTLQDSVDEWFTVNWPFLLAWFAIACELLIAVPLFIYQAFLISTNQTSWEHARRSSITYLRSLADDRSPFDRGCVTNWRVFFCGSSGDANKWVHRGSSAPTGSAAATQAAGRPSASRAAAAPVSPADDTAIM